MKKIIAWWKKKSLSDKILFFLFCFFGLVFMARKNLLPITKYTIENGQYVGKTYWLGKEL